MVLAWWLYATMHRVIGARETKNYNLLPHHSAFNHDVTLILYQLCLASTILT